MSNSNLYHSLRLQPFQLQQKINYYNRAKKSRKHKPNTQSQSIVTNLWEQTQETEISTIQQGGFTIHTQYDESYNKFLTLDNSQLLKEKFKNLENSVDRIQEVDEEKKSKQRRSKTANAASKSLLENFSVINKSEKSGDQIAPSLLSQQPVKELFKYDSILQNNQINHNKNSSESVLRGNNNPKISSQKTDSRTKSSKILGQIESFQNPKDSSLHNPKESGRTYTTITIANTQIDRIKQKLKSVSLVNRMKNIMPDKGSIRDKSQLIYSEFRDDLIGAIYKKDIERIIEVGTQMMEKCVDQNLLEFFIQIPNFLGCIKFQQIIQGDIDKAAFFFHQYKIIADIGFFYLNKAEAYMHLGNVAIKLVQYENALSIFKKALEFTWIGNDINLELDIYEKIGLAYYYLGQPDDAIFYHNKFALQDNEVMESPIRIISSAIIKRAHKQFNQEPLRQLNKNFLFHVSLPILNKFEYQAAGQPISNRERYLCHYSKCVNYHNVQADQIIERLVQEQDFLNYTIERPTYGRLRMIHDRQQKMGILTVTVKDQIRKENASILHNENFNQKLDFTFADKDRKSTLRRALAPKFKTIFGTDKDETSNQYLVPRFVDDDPEKFNIPWSRLMRARQQQTKILDQKYNKRLEDKIKKREKRSTLITLMNIKPVRFLIKLKIQYFF